MFDKLYWMSWWGLFLRKWSFKVVITLLRYSQMQVNNSAFWVLENHQELLEMFTACYRPVILQKRINNLWILQWNQCCFAVKSSGRKAIATGRNVGFGFLLQRGLIKNNINFTWIIECYSIV